MFGRMDNIRRYGVGNPHYNPFGMYDRNTAYIIRRTGNGDGGNSMCRICFLYTTLFSYHGLGDILVLLFFGIIPVCCTYYVCMPLHQQIPTGEVIASSIACGLAIDALLIVNNYRDIDNDRSNGKITLAVRLGESKTRRLYESIGYIAAGIMIILVFFDLYQIDKFIPTYAIYLIYIILHRQSYQEMKSINKGAKLNQVLGLTARNILVFGILSVAAILSVIFI